LGTKLRFLIAAFLLDACYLGYAAIQHLHKKLCTRPFPSCTSVILGARSSLHWWEWNCGGLLKLRDTHTYLQFPLTVLTNQATEYLIDFITFCNVVRIRAFCFCSESHKRQGLKLALGITLTSQTPQRSPFQFRQLV
jgi:hypothetical protein